MALIFSECDFTKFAFVIFLCQNNNKFSKSISLKFISFEEISRKKFHLKIFLETFFKTC